MKAKISVIVPVYNVEEYLRTCLDSLINQTMKDIVVYCVNDGSTDGSLKILEEYAKKDSRIVVINKKNGGLSSARNAALSKCETEYVMFCDSDDSFNERMCEVMLDRIEKDKSDVAVCEKNIIYYVHEEMRKSDEQYYSLKFYGKKKITDDVILKTNVSVLNKIFKMDVIRKYDITFPDKLNNEDFYFYNVFMSRAETISFVHEKLYNYVRRDNSIMSNNFKAETLSLDHLVVAEKLFDYYNKIGYINEHIDLFWRQWISSYWFSFEHSSVSKRKEVTERAVKFANEKISSFPPRSRALREEVEAIITRGSGRFSKRRIKRAIIGIYKKIKPAYRQQLRMNAHIEELQSKYDELSKKLDEIMERK